MNLQPVHAELLQSMFIELSIQLASVGEHLSGWLQVMAWNRHEEHTR